VAAFIAGGFLALMTAWLEGGSTRRPGQADVAFHHMAAHALRSAPI